MTGANVRRMARTAIGCEPLVGSLTPSKKREYRVTNKLQEGKRPLYAVVFNFIDSRYFNVFATVGGNRVTFLHFVFLFIVVLSSLCVFYYKNYSFVGVKLMYSLFKLV